MIFALYTRQTKNILRINIFTLFSQSRQGGDRIAFNLRSL